ncbi:hypothetical protein KL921_001318 [Ogataea angusta]|uniref:Autophagy-related protein n=1 Tax=Pichia angusta TaxID=870730 RepID=A0ABQ7RZZ3_PICAN|nr:hypothetical protein KL921_001318 [Ogataea angusta]KAG7841774.1 hypothetical protein KL942_001653 [Ogataea angusta]KAG7850648.1 hypothetical protein KL940_001225 [Ogataea angusta]
MKSAYWASKTERQSKPRSDSRQIKLRAFDTLHESLIRQPLVSDEKTTSINPSTKAERVKIDLGKPLPLEYDTVRPQSRRAPRLITKNDASFTKVDTSFSPPPRTLNSRLSNRARFYETLKEIPKHNVEQTGTPESQLNAEENALSPREMRLRRLRQTLLGNEGKRTQPERTTEAETEQNDASENPEPATCPSQKASRIRGKFLDRIPVICEKVEESDIPEIDKRKYLVPSDLTVGQFVYVIRKRIQLPSEKAIFIFVNDILPPTASLMSTIYEQYKDEDGFLYILYSGENTFGQLDGVEEML